MAIRIDATPNMPVESKRARRIGMIVIGRPFVILYMNEDARRIIRGMRSRPSVDCGLPGDIMKFCRDAADILARCRRNGQRAVQLRRETMSTVPLLLRALFIEARPGVQTSPICVAIEETCWNRIGLDHPAKELSLCSADHEPKTWL